MAKLTKRAVDAAIARSSDYFIWDDDLAGFGLRVFTSGKRSYLVQYRAAGRTRRYTIGLHGAELLKQRERRRASSSGGLRKVRTRRKSAGSTRERSR